ncbi:MAG: hypothetical protein M1825_005326 [Sarcosagium campestre]|nr:MAG: hypothetical protein M1825_005326 [Sarcosagium campestre]
MFSYLRSHHRRSPSSSTPSSPVLPSPIAIHSTDTPLQPLSPQRLSYPPSASLGDHHPAQAESPLSPAAPVLPPIPRVASRHNDQLSERGPDPDDTSHRSLQTRQDRPSDLRAARQDRSRPRVSVVTSHDQGTDMPGILEASAPSGWNAAGRDSNQPSMPSSSSSNVPAQHPHQMYRATDHSPLTKQPSPPEAPLSSSQQTRSAKTRLNLRNPMALLMRRRTPQLTDGEFDPSGNRSLTIPAMTLPDGYDPRIRGKLVHDFSAPRPKRDMSYNERNHLATGSLVAGESRNTGRRAVSASQAEATPHPSILEPDSPRAAERDHAAVFTEDFGDLGMQAGRGARNQVGSRVAIQDATASLSAVPEQYNASTLPPFARNLPPTVNLGATPRDDSGAGTDKQAQAPPPPGRKAPEVPTEAERDVEDSNDASAFNSTLGEFANGLPKHLRSNASRFSFDLAGVGSAAQEKLLEEKHRHSTTARKSAHPAGKASDDEADLDDEDFQDYDDVDFDEDDGLEEKIPGVNVDAEDDEVGHQVDPGIMAFDFQSTAPYEAQDIATPLALFTEGVSTPRDADGKVIGFASSKESPVRYQDLGGQMLTPPLHSPARAGAGLGLIGAFADVDRLSPASPTPPRSDIAGTSPQLPSDQDDDLYFDDGLIEHPDADTTADAPFDESVFDDERLSDRRLSPPGDVQSRSVPGDDEPRSDVAPEVDREAFATNDDRADRAMPTRKRHPTLVQGEASTAPRETVNLASAGLTEDNLNAYHSALVAAANAAAASGKFSHRDDASTVSFDDQRSQPSQATRRTVSGGFIDDAVMSPKDNLFGYEDEEEDDMDDDAMVAAANAEVLANDADGFYGQEFGFYAHSNGSSEADFMHGGYFGAKGADGLIRSPSGRIACREPNLTPITERSEYSNRNSFISLQMARDQSSQSVQSPGLAQLAGLMGPLDEEEDLSLDGLLKLRRGAWGGSNGSLRSSGSAGSAAGSSPMSHLAPLNVQHARGASLSPVGRNSSDLTLASSSSKGHGSPTLSSDGSLPGSPTLTMALSGQSRQSWGAVVGGGQVDGSQAFSSTANSPALPSSPATPSPVKRGSAGDWKLLHHHHHHHHHQRNHSGESNNAAADSVSYLSEEDEVGTKRWVVEKRRTSGTGQIEILGREVVAGGRI